MILSEPKHLRYLKRLLEMKNSLIIINNELN